MKKYDKLIITAEPKVINMMMGILSEIHNKCKYITYGNNRGSLIIPEEYDFVKVKRKNSRLTKKLIKDCEKFDINKIKRIEII